MNKVSVMGIDLAKHVFQVYGADKKGQRLFSKSIKRAQLIKFISEMPTCLIGMEACGSAHFWAREFQRSGHKVKLIAPQFVKPFVKSNKNDAADAEAIAEAVVRPTMRFVPIKQSWQQDIQSVHRVRQRWVRAQTATINEIHGLLGEYGLVVSRSPRQLLKQIGELIAPEDTRLSIEMKHLMSLLIEEYKELQSRREESDEKLQRVGKDNEVCKRLSTIPGIGHITATAILTVVSDPTLFKNGREFAAWLGLVPRQQSSGGKNVLLGISKRGDSYIRSLLVHGSRSALHHATGKTDRLSIWAVNKKETRGSNRATVALANKNARIIWALLSRNEDYRTVA